MPPLMKQSLAVIVGANISRLRQARGLSQKDLATMLDMGADSLSRIERGFVAPRFGRLERFAEALGSSVADLFMDSNEPGKVPTPLTPKEELVMLADRISDMARQVVAGKDSEPALKRVRCRRPRRRTAQPACIGAAQ